MSSTADLYTKESERFLNFLREEEKSLEEVSVSEIHEYLARRQEKGGVRKSAGIHKILSAVSVFFDFLVLENTVKGNPVREVERPRLGGRLPHAISFEDIEKFFSHLSAEDPVGLRDRALFELIYSCGLRVSEACGLLLEHLMLSEGLIRVLGKGQKERFVPLGDESLKWLKLYLKDSRPGFLRPNDSKTQNVFLSRRGKGISRKTVWKRFKQWSEAAGMRGKVHGLRHSFATHLLAGGAGLRDVQELLGHSSINTTQIYTQVEDRQLREIHRKLHPRNRVGVRE